MAHLHEVLAVDKELEAVAWKIFEEALVTFTKKTDHFMALDKRVEMFSEDRQKEGEALREQKAMTTTVADKLEYVSGHFVRFMDALAQKENTNQQARADVILPDGTVLAKDVPATLLLALEGKLSKLRRMYEVLPTLQPGVDWEADPQMGEGVFKAAEPIMKHKTEKTLRYTVMVPSTDKHPAQVEKWYEDVPIGQSITNTWSGMISPAKKSELLERVDMLTHSIKQARMRANETEVVKFDIGQKLLDFIHEVL